ncbi:MAG: hypothetical protein HYV17_11685 [Xanthomonadales bacterium]|nr:hypothetical protein [Xanthomonadales bacterium]
MVRVSVSDFAGLSAAQLRLEEAKHLFELFEAAQDAEPNYGLFLLTTYFDSLLFCLVSIEEMVDAQTKYKLNSLGSFKFFKALRNIATHHSVLSGVQGKFDRPIARIVSVVGSSKDTPSEQFYVMPDKLESIFASILRLRKQEEPTIDAARAFLQVLKSRGERILVADLIRSVIADVETRLK